LRLHGAQRDPGSGTCCVARNHQFEVSFSLFQQLLRIGVLFELKVPPCLAQLAACLQRIKVVGLEFQRARGVRETLVDVGCL